MGRIASRRAAARVCVPARPPQPRSGQAYLPWVARGGRQRWSRGLGGSGGAVSPRKDDGTATAAAAGSPAVAAAAALAAGSAGSLSFGGPGTSAAAPVVLAAACSGGSGVTDVTLAIGAQDHRCVLEVRVRVLAGLLARCLCLDDPRQAPACLPACLPAARPAGRRGGAAATFSPASLNRASDTPPGLTHRLPTPHRVALHCVLPWVLLLSLCRCCQEPPPS